MFRICFGLLLFGMLALFAASEDECPAVRHDCTCEFDSSVEDGGEPVVADTMTKTEALAAAAGAMTPLLLGGAGFGIYKFCKSRGDMSMGDERSGSRMSDEMDDQDHKRFRPPPYDSRRGSQVVSLTAAEHGTRRGSGNIGF